jgi:hypothetical protein
MTARKKAGTPPTGQQKRLTVRKQTLKDLSAGDGPMGGWIRPPISWGCPQPAPASMNCTKTV